MPKTEKNILVFDFLTNTSPFVNMTIRRQGAAKA